ncbi:SDR family NAD(P)-dependent oxidoreductase [Marinivivus vitaminiproducens]|uniref:SDR family NAD(P)-dependent oxidoreductase n=1 Tax=Marinivivus vitaminiproducens TaxID=3035935 RepID=UPI0027A8067E|nr:SDR family NAD(P)-dependent oxidoreductase [Geminicoccaceae bacterium SCSIO 64248]
MPSPYRSAVITGASSGIGAAFADVLSPSTDLLLVGRDPDRLAAVAARHTHPERRVDTLIADLATDEGRAAVVERADASAVDLLVNNAGVGAFGAVLDHDPEAERQVGEVNVMAPLILTRALLPGMIARAGEAGRRAGCILVSSQAAFTPVPYFATYAASKAFILLWGEALAEELRGEPVDVLTLCPGATRSNFGRQAGFPVPSLPGAAHPRDVAGQALRALGRESVLVSGRVSQLAFLPMTLPRRITTMGLGKVMGLVSRRAVRRR